MPLFALDLILSILCWVLKTTQTLNKTLLIINTPLSYRMATYYYHYCLLLLCIACAAQEFHGHCYDSYYVRASPGRIANVITVDPTPGDLQAALNPNVSMPLHTCNLYCGMTLSWEWSRS